MSAPYRYPVSSISLAGKKVWLEYDPKDSENWGQYHHDDGMITLSDAVEDLASFKTAVRHEMIHVALAMSGLTHLLSNELEESIVRALENLLLPALEDFERKLKK